MAKKKIYVIDSLLIYIGTILLASSLFFLYTISQELLEGIVVNEQLMERVAAALAVFVAGLASLFIGKAVRQKGQDVILVWDVLNYSEEITVRKLQKKTGFSREFLHEAVLLINKQSRDIFIWDEDTGVIESSRLNNRSLSTARPPKKGFSFMIFILLSVVAFPAGIFYAVLKRRRHSLYSVG